MVIRNVNLNFYYIFNLLKTLNHKKYEKKILSAPLWGIFALSLLSSCRIEERLQVEDKRFAVFTSKSMSYADGFAFLMKRYDNLHKTNLSGINNKPIIGTLASTEKATSLLQNGESYVEFNVRSQIFNGDNGDKWIIYPRVQGNKVVDLVYAVLTDKETKASYVNFNKQEASYKECEILFQEGLDRLRKRTKLNISASIKPVAVDTDKEWPTEIQVEDVSVPGRVLPNPGGGSPGGGCIAHSNCINPGIDSGGGDGSGGGGGGGGGGYGEDPTDNSCYRMKNKINTDKGRSAISDLETKAKQPGSNEYAYRQDKDGNMKMYEGERDNVVFPLDSNIEGIFHDHQSLGVAMLSPRDIRTLLIIARMQSDDSVGNAFVGMIPANGDNYFISFNGTKADIPVIYNDQLEQFSKDYDRIQLTLSMYSPPSQSGLSDKQLQKLFFDITDKMGLKGKVNLIKEKNGNTSSITRNPDGTIADPKPC